MTKVYKEGKLVDTFETTNSFSPKNHKPVCRPGYKRMWTTQLENNKGMLIATGVSVMMTFLTVSGSMVLLNAKNTQIANLEAHVTRVATMYGVSESNYQNALRNPIVKYEIPKETTAQIKMVFGEDAELMTKVAVCESGLKSNAQNKTSSARGIFQVLSKLHNIDKKWLDIPLINALVAKSLFDASGTQPWNSSRNCWLGVK